MSDKTQASINNLFINTVQQGFNTLDPGIQKEIIHFIQSKQHTTGSFVDRSGNPDLYYSLFGAWLSKALDLKSGLDKLKDFVKHQKINSKYSLINDLVLIMIKTILPDHERLPSTFKIVQHILRDKSNISFTYKLFFLLLILDLRPTNNLIINLFARVVLLIYHFPNTLPCSNLSALIIVKHMLGLNYVNEKTRLLSYYATSGGFRSHEKTAYADMLSTAVALFALNQIKYDLRTITPFCMDFIESNYHEGAFLAGNGDEVLDLEYTFYGLLALGALTK